MTSSKSSSTTTTTNNYTVLQRRYHREEAPSPPSMSLVGLHERTLHYQDLTQAYYGDAASPERPRSPFAALPLEPGQDPSQIFHRHLLAALDKAIRIVNEEDANDNFFPPMEE